MVEHCTWDQRPSLIKEIKQQLRSVMTVPEDQMIEIPLNKRHLLKEFCVYSKYTELIEVSDRTTADRILAEYKPNG